MPCTRFMLLRGGKVVAEGWWYPYNPDSPHRLYSLSKSFTSIAVGLAVEEGLMSLDDLVLDHFPEEAPAEPDENLAAIRVRDLLRMNTGHLKEQADAFWSTERDTWAESFLAVPVGLKPGTHFVYNTGATYMAGLMVQRLTGGTLIDYLTPRLFAPLGIEGATWQSDDEGYNVGFGETKWEELTATAQMGERVER
jgi:CubicO group peptidase (beta-lactamase class C family)